MSVNTYLILFWDFISDKLAANCKIYSCKFSFVQHHEKCVWERRKWSCVARIFKYNCARRHKPMVVRWAFFFLFRFFDLKNWRFQFGCFFFHCPEIGFFLRIGNLAFSIWGLFFVSQFRVSISFFGAYFLFFMSFVVECFFKSHVQNVIFFPAFFCVTFQNWRFSISYFGRVFFFVFCIKSFFLRSLKFFFFNKKTPSWLPLV